MKKYLFIIIALVIVSLLLTTFFILNRPKSFPPNNIVGGDKDEHGCIGSAGYSWCEVKEKCLRIWEETCDETDNSIKTCGIENCHGMEIICGSKPAEVCTAMYQLGDKCRQYAKCSLQESTCQQEKNPQFTNCKNCVESCLEKYKKDQIKIFKCENQC